MKICHPSDDDDDDADTVGCCMLKVENITCVPPNKLQFDFLGKGSIRYFNIVEVELPLYKATGEFETGKKSDRKIKVGGDDFSDMLDMSKLNAYLKELMSGLTTKVYCAYNVFISLDNQKKDQGDIFTHVRGFTGAHKTCKTGENPDEATKDICISTAPATMPQFCIEFCGHFNFSTNHQG